MKVIDIRWYSVAASAIGFLNNKSLPGINRHYFAVSLILVNYVFILVQKSNPYKQVLSYDILFFHFKPIGIKFSQNHPFYCTYLTSWQQASA